MYKENSTLLTNNNRDISGKKIDFSVDHCQIERTAIHNFTDDDPIMILIFEIKIENVLCYLVIYF